MRALQLSVLPMAILTIAGTAASQYVHAQQAGQVAARLVAFEDFMRVT